MNILVSACLLGLSCRYDGKSVPNEKVIELTKKHNLIPVCPEIYGGLPTPRYPSEVVGFDKSLVTIDNPKGLKLMNTANLDVTAEFEKGAYSALKLAKLYDCKVAILKSHSPSCGYGEIYDGSFSGKFKEGNGMTAQLLYENGITVYSENSIKELES